jgi:hypothetical protein
MDELERLKTILNEAKHIPFSKYVSIDKEEASSIISRIEATLPNEVKEAFIVNAKKDEILKDAYKKSEEIINFAKEREKEILSESSIMKDASIEKEKLLQTAKEEALNIKREAEKYTYDLLQKIRGVIEKALLIIAEASEEFKSDSSSRPNP